MKTITAIYQTDVINRNGHIFPKEVVRKAFNEYETKIKEGTAVGRLSGKATPEINLKEISHLITDIKETPSGFEITAKVLDTLFGKVLEDMVMEKVSYGLVCTAQLSGNIITDCNIIGIDIIPKE